MVTEDGFDSRSLIESRCHRGSIPRRR